MLSTRVISTLRDAKPADWNAFTEGNPLVSHEFLAALEESGSAVTKSGWAAHHLLLEDDGKLVGAAPCYLKSHSYGEYVFDHGWADAFHRAGGRYYPKLQCSVPFSPVTGPRLLAATNEHKRDLATALLEACDHSNASSVHITFAHESDEAFLRPPHWLKRQDIQFHWHNNGYGSFDDFLAALSSNKRKNIRKERQSFAPAGITFERKTGDALTEDNWDHFFAFYMDTGSRKWGSPYLTRSFFSLIHETMRDRILLVMAYRAGRCIAGALNFIGDGVLYGRNWGCSEHHPYLHFEVCYYQAIDFAIAHGLRVVEAGAQGEHKLARGYLPVKTTSFHHLRHKGLARAVDEYLEHERAAIAENQEILSTHSPFRHSGEDHDL